MLSRTAWPWASSKTSPINFFTTLKATSASNKATRISLQPAVTSYSLKRQRRRRPSKICVNCVESLSNTLHCPTTVTPTKNNPLAKLADGHSGQLRRVLTKAQRETLWCMSSYEMRLKALLTKCFKVPLKVGDFVDF